jgi:hypothetical protein
MKLLIALVLAAAPSFAADTTYTVTPPASGSTCPRIAGATNPCFYVVLGDFADTYLFSVEADATYTFSVSGNYWHRCTVSGRAHQCYTESLAVTGAVVVDAAGETVLQLAADASGVWSGAADLPPGDYAYVISATVAGNRPGEYDYGIAVAPLE